MSNVRPQIPLVVAGIALALVPWPANAQPDQIPANQVCTSSSGLFVGPCYTVHARVQQGAHNVGLWI